MPLFLSLSSLFEQEENINFWKVVQYLFFEQWNELKAYANEKGIDIASKMVIDAYTMSKEEVKNRDVILKVVR